MRIYFLIVGVIFFSCGSKQVAEAPKNIDATSETVTSQRKIDVNENYVFTDLRLKEYDAFLKALNVGDVDNMQLATEKFKTLFAKSSKELCDSAIYLFSGFYDRVHDKIEDLHYADTTNYDSLVLDFESSDPVRLSKKLTDYSERLSRNGFYVSMTEGMTYIKKDLDYIQEHFYSDLSPLMVEYLEELNKENKEGFGDDGGLVIGPTSLVDRIAWWEHFNQSHPDFVFKELRYDLQRIYTTSLITGEDNTPLFYDDTQPLDEYFKTAYDHLFAKYPTTETAQLLTSYYLSLQKHDTAEIKKFQEGYLKGH